MARDASIADGEFRSIVFLCCDENGDQRHEVKVDLHVQHAPMPMFEKHPFEFEVGFENITQHFNEVVAETWEEYSSKLGLTTKDRLFELKSGSTVLLSGT